MRKESPLTILYFLNLLHSLPTLFPLPLYPCLNSFLSLELLTYCSPLIKTRRGVRILGFGILGQNIYRFRWSCPMGRSISLRVRPIHRPSILQLLKARFQKFEKFCLRCPSFSKFTFSDLRQIQGFK